MYSSFLATAATSVDQSVGWSVTLWHLFWFIVEEHTQQQSFRRHVTSSWTSQRRRVLHRLLLLRAVNKNHWWWVVNVNHYRNNKNNTTMNGGSREGPWVPSSPFLMVVLMGMVSSFSNVGPGGDTMSVLCISQVSLQKKIDCDCPSLENTLEIRRCIKGVIVLEVQGAPNPVVYLEITATTVRRVLIPVQRGEMRRAAHLL